MKKVENRTQDLLAISTKKSQKIQKIPKMAQNPKNRLFWKKCHFGTFWHPGQKWGRFWTPLKIRGLKNVLREARENGQNMSKKGSKMTPKMAQKPQFRPLFYISILDFPLEKGWKWQKSGQKVQKKWKKGQKSAKKGSFLGLQKLNMSKNAQKMTLFCTAKKSQKEKKVPKTTKNEKKVLKKWSFLGSKNVKKREKMAKKWPFLGYP